MDAKPAKALEESDEDQLLHPGAGLQVVSGCAALSACVTIGTLVPWFIAGGVGDLQSLLAEGGSPYATDFQMPLVVIAGALITLIGAVIAGIGAAKDSRKLGYAALAVCFAGAAAMLGPAVYLNLVLDETFVRLQLSPDDVTFSEKEQTLLDMTAAVFNTCCFKVYDPRCGTAHGVPNDPGCVAPDYTTGDIGLQITALDGTFDANELRDNQLPVRDCSDVNRCASGVYPPATQILTDLGVDVTSLLCTCYSSNSSLNAWDAAIAKLDSCTKLRAMKVVNAGPIDIPQTPIKFNQLQGLISATRTALSPCLGGQNPSDNTCASPIETMSVVGKFWAPESTYPGDDDEDNGWSCGLGYAKSVAFTMYLALDQASEISIYGAIAGGSLMAFVVIMEAIYWAMGGGADDDGAWDMDHYNDGTNAY